MKFILATLATLCIFMSNLRPLHKSRAKPRQGELMRSTKRGCPGVQGKKKAQKPLLKISVYME